MKRAAMVISAAGLALTILPSFAVLQGVLGLEASKLMMLAGTVAWFASAPSWMNREKRG
jgi:hypothetical protein